MGLMKSATKNNEILDQVLKELQQAESKHPNWPDDQIHAAAIVAEESGELVRAALNFRYEDGSKEEMKMEAIQTAAMAIRFLKHLD